VYTGPTSTTCDQLATWTPPTATDICTPAGSLIWTNPAATPGGLFPVGDSIITYIVEDAAGNKDTCSFTITVVDNTLPVAKTFTVTVRAQCAVTLPTPKTIDNCSVDSIEGVPDVTFPITLQGSTTVTWTFTDAAGNSTTAEQYVFIEDELPPDWTYFPPNLNLECSDSISPDSTGIPTAIDNCALDTIFYSDVVTDLSPDNCIRATIKRTWTARDTSNNIRSDDQIINIDDTEKPVLICRDTFVATPDDVWDPWHLNSSIIFSDNCGIDTIFLFDEWFHIGGDETSGFCPDTVYRKYIVYDMCGKASNICTQKITVTSVDSCSECQDTVPKRIVNMNNAPDSVYVWNNKTVTREGACCDTEDNTSSWGCISFDVYLDEDAVGLWMDVYAPGPPGGHSLYYKVDCQDSASLGEIICLTGGRWYTLTFCKPGQDKSNYEIGSISGAIVPDSLTTRADVDCYGELEVTGLEPGTITWEVSHPLGADTLTKYLSCTDCANPVFTPDSVSPALIKYRVCGMVGGYPECEGDTIFDCAEVIVNVLPPVAVTLNVDLAAICKDSVPLIEPDIPFEDPNLTYTYEWYDGFDGPDGPGTVVWTQPTYKPPTIGEYSLVVTEVTSHIPCNTAITNFNIYWDTIGPVLLVPPDTLILDCSHPNPQPVIDAWVASAEAFEAEDTTQSVIVYDDYTPFEPHCSLARTIHFWAFDYCGNITRDSAVIFILDTVPPDITCPNDTDNIADLDSCLIHEFNNLIPPAVYDSCDPDTIRIFWEKTGATTGTGWGPVTGSFNVGVTKVTYTAYDLCDNTDTCSNYVTIYDEQPPNVITCPDSAFATAPPPLCVIDSVVFDSVQYTDNCNTNLIVLTWVKTDQNGDTIAADSGHANGTPFPVGITTVTYIITDAYGNASTCQFVVTVNDSVPPTIITCPNDTSFTLPPDVCEIDIVLPSPIAKDPCDEIVSIRHNSPFTGTNDSIASGTYPGGVHTITWIITDRSGNNSTCEQVVTIYDLQPVTLDCPPDMTVPADFGKDYATNIAIDSAIHDDNCPYVLYWGMTDTLGATIDSSYQTMPINVLTSYDTLYVGTYTVTYSMIDVNGDTIVCDFDIRVTARPIIDCPNDTIVWAADSVCSNTFDPGIPELLQGSAPIDWTWVMTGATTGSGGTNDANVLPDSIGLVEFELGVTRITWIATNISGADTCFHEITVLDTIRPVIAALDSLEGCVEPIQMAVYSQAEDDLYYPDRPDFMVFAAGDTTLDLTIIDMDDNCSLDSCPNNISWRIDFSPVTDQHGVLRTFSNPVFTGTGQLSDHGSDIMFPGDGTYMSSVDHWITYRITDCNGNVSFSQTRKVTVLPRPKIEKVNTP
jgi:hypothetical protein